ncbi:MAG: UbiA family prenyltransferase [Pseudomonadota bacterium]
MNVSQPEPPVVDSAEIALVVDLDGTLCKTDTLHEGLLAIVAARPQTLFKLPKWLSEGRAGFKARLADQTIVAPDELPLNEGVIELVKAAKSEGRRTALVSAADHRQVTAVAEATGLFDEAYGSAEGTNLKGAEKASFLNQHYGSKMYDYVGDSDADVPVWHAARRAISVRARPGLRQALEASNANAHHIDPPEGQGKAMLRALRPHQWSKNLLMFIPMLAAHDASGVLSVVLGFIAFCLTASSVYVINDLLDLAADRAHPRKRLRPFAAGDLSLATGAKMFAGLVTGALVFSLLSGSGLFMLSLLVYFIATFAYSVWLKRKLIADVLTLAGLYTIRILAGGAAASVVLSPWILGFSMFLFLALAAVKRHAELTDQLASGRQSVGRAYTVDDIPVVRGIGLSASQAATLVLALYISSDAVQELYSTPYILWLICPIVLYWSLRMVTKAHRGSMTDDPIVFATTDLPSLLLILTCAALGVLAAVI